LSSLPSHDACCFLDMVPNEVLRAAVPNWRFRYIPEDVLPALREAGVGEEEIHTMMVANPARILGS
jgi:phosphotriesterase-related protein